MPEVLLIPGQRLPPDPESGRIIRGLWAPFFAIEDSLGLCMKAEFDLAIAFAGFSNLAD